MVDLELVDTHDMVHELMTRFDHAAFIGMKAGLKGPEDHEYVRSWIGNTHTVSGLLDDLKGRTFELFHEAEFDK